MKALVTSELDENLIDELKKLCDTTFAGWGQTRKKLNEKKLINLLEDKEILIVGYEPVTKKVINSAKNLKLIACTRSSPVNVNLEVAYNNNIKVVHTPGRNSDTTAEYTIGLAISIARNIPKAHKALKEGEYLAETKPENSNYKDLKEDVTWSLTKGSPYIKYKGNQLKNKTYGIIGYGKIGQKVAKLARAFEMKVYIYDPFVPEIEINQIPQKKVDFDSLLKKSDFISCHAKVTEQTRGLLDKKEFEKMKESAYLINTARGALIKEEALIEALRKKKIAGAALDVYKKEPLSNDHPFVQELDNIIITPHLGGATKDVITNHTKMVINEISRFINDEKLLFEAK